MKTKLSKLYIAIGVAALLSGCATNHNEVKHMKKEVNTPHELVAEHSKEFLEDQNTLRAKLEEVTPKQDEPAPVMPAYNPMDEIPVTLNVDNGGIQFVLQALAKQSNMNLLLHPNVVESENTISVHFEDVPASTVFRQVMQVADLNGKVEGNILVVNPLEERIFHLNFPETEITARFSAGGNALGSSSGGASTVSSDSMAGNFKVDGISSKNTNPYDQLETMLEILIGKNPTSSLSGDLDAAATVKEVGAISKVEQAKSSDTPLYSLSRMAGTLFVRAKPSIVKNVSKLVYGYKKMLSGQILLEAQILEVTLNDTFRFGINWNYLRDHVSGGFGVTGLALGGMATTMPEAQQGPQSVTIPAQVLPFVAGEATSHAGYIEDENFSAVVDIMKGFGTVKVLSNPTIRAKHAQPAVISVGTSIAYISRAAAVTSTSTGGATTSQDVQTSSVFDGLIIGVVPFIADDGKISLIIDPIQSDVNKNSLVLVDAGGTTKVTLPVIDLKSISTTLQVGHGDVVILGGLIDKTNSDTESGTPFISKIPVIGYLFKKKLEITAVRELVLVIKVSKI